MGINIFNVHGCSALAQSIHHPDFFSLSAARLAWKYASKLIKLFLCLLIFVRFYLKTPSHLHLSLLLGSGLARVLLLLGLLGRLPGGLSLLLLLVVGLGRHLRSTLLYEINYVSFGLLSVFEVHCTCENIHIQRHNFLPNYLKALTHICNFHALQCMQWSGCHCRQLSCSGWIIVQVQVFD